MTPEKKVQSKILAYLKELEHAGKPVIHGRRDAGGFAYVEGVSDIWAAINGRHVEIEVKRPGGQLRTMQEKWRDRCKASNIVWCCCDSIDDFKKFIVDNFPELFE